jgi:predicted metal-dependent phosphoesterase TrpH
VIDLHMHTTASDGRCTPAELVDHAARASLTVMAVTDHDTTASTAEIRELAAARGIEAVNGIEVTAVERGRDIHVLAYFCDTEHPVLAEFLARGRAARVARLHQIAARLAEASVPIDPAPLEARARGGRSVGRPPRARALVAAGPVRDVREAFDRWIAEGQSAFVRRRGPRVAEVVRVVHETGGRASLAHPGLTRVDDRLDEFRDAGLDALEVYHSAHDANTVGRYEALAERLGFLRTGGSDFHGDPEQGRPLGGVTLGADDWARFHDGRAGRG